jgi:uncharacterized protein (TIGR03437 family)
LLLASSFIYAQAPSLANGIANAAGITAAQAAAPGGLAAIFGSNLSRALPHADTASPVINAGGVVPIGSTVNTISTGSWAAIYGNNLGNTTATWNGDFPTSLGGAKVTVDGKPAFLYFASPGQINIQVPDDTATGTVTVVVTNANGSGTSTVTLSQFAPSFPLLDSKHPAGIILRTNGSGAFGGGTYDIVGPTGTSLGYPTVAAKAGDALVLFGVGFGPTTPVVPAGQAFSGAATANNTVTFNINGTNVTPSFSGLSSAGLFQFNITVPSGLGTGDVPITATVGGATTPQFVLSLQ